MQYYAKFYRKPTMTEIDDLDLEFRAAFNGFCGRTAALRGSESHLKEMNLVVGDVYSNVQYDATMNRFYWKHDNVLDKLVEFDDEGYPVMTLADLDETCDFAPLDTLISKYAGWCCLEFEFNDINTKPGYRALEYNVAVLVRDGGRDWDDDMGFVGATSRIKECVKVPVSAEQPIDLIARAIASEIRGIEGNVHANA